MWDPVKGLVGRFPEDMVHGYSETEHVCLLSSPPVPDGAIQYCLSVSQQLFVMGDQLFNTNGRSKIMLKQKKS